ncbi:MAG: 5-(carboxyamino)imidazole ribonucleotide synthase [Acidobacteria bacterium]|nr:5-(carboxyamino)imidazole ribonucleotide synthase [Acidobacteriota bacterium]
MILPGSTIGVLGSGQLGRMFAIAARRMGYRVHTFSPDQDTPTGQIADEEIIAAYDDLDAVRAFARNVSVVTFEFENVSSAAVEAASEFAPVRPGGHVLHTSQHRLREKTFLANNGFPVAPFKRVTSLEELLIAIDEIGCPAVLKTAGFGYDGKGQSKITSPEQAQDALKTLGQQEAILEAFINFEREISVVAARSIDGAFVHYGAVANEHRNHILDITVAPAPIPPEVNQEAVAITRGVLETLGVVGVMCVEFFLTREGKLLINETAPRPHNSGHFTFDASLTSQFEQQLRAVCGLPLGSTELLRPAAMANLLGDLWQGGEPNWAAACAFSNVKVHLYGKLEPRKGRKMGHLTALAATAEEAERLVREARAALTA